MQALPTQDVDSSARFCIDFVRQAASPQQQEALNAAAGELLKDFMWLWERDKGQFMNCANLLLERTGPVAGPAMSTMFTVFPGVQVFKLENGIVAVRLTETSDGMECQ
jgi:hypothetical protein